jgi:hypothetical protein
MVVHSHDSVNFKAVLNFTGGTNDKIRWVNSYFFRDHIPVISFTGAHFTKIVKVETNNR